jgi:hypothetical protein
MRSPTILPPPPCLPLPRGAPSGTTSSPMALPVHSEFARLFFVRGLRRLEVLPDPVREVLGRELDKLLSPLLPREAPPSALSLQPVRPAARTAAPRSVSTDRPQTRRSPCEPPPLPPVAPREASVPWPGRHRSRQQVPPSAAGHHRGAIFPAVPRSRRPQSHRVASVPSSPA